MIKARKSILPFTSMYTNIDVFFPFYFIISHMQRITDIFFRLDGNLVGISKPMRPKKSYLIFFYFSFQIKTVSSMDLSFATTLRATSHTRLRARDHNYTSSTHIGGKGGARPSSLHTMLEGPMKRVCACKMDVKST